MTAPNVARERLTARAIEHFAQHGIGDQSLRQIAAALGTSHRMLIYHFGSKEGLLSEVVQGLEAAEQRQLEAMTSDPDESLVEQGTRYWTQAADNAQVYGPLFFELASHAMQGQSHTEQLRTTNVERWIDVLTTFWTRAGYVGDAARTQARLNLAVARGLLHDLLLTGDRAAVDAAMALYASAFLDDGA